jgi:predicted nucleic acid-binding protein
MNAGKFFLDTNIFVYTFEERPSAKRDRARQLVAQALETRLGVISYQVVQEFLNVATRKFAKPMSVSDAQLYLARILAPLCEVFPDAALYSQALSISGEMGIGFYDALIVSSAIGASAAILWSEDLQHGRRIRSLEIRDPFRTGTSAGRA